MGLKLPPDDQRRRDFEKGHKGEVTQLAPWRRATAIKRFSTQEFQVAVKCLFGLGMTCLILFTDRTLRSKAPTVDRRVGV